jgi:hypothetical protein
MAKLPAIQFYPGDWKKDAGVQALDLHDRGAWLEILMLMHDSDDRGKLLLNGKPMPDAAIARILGLDEARWKQTRSNLEAYGVVSIDEETGALLCRRMVRDEALRQVRAEAGAKGGAVSRPPARSKPEAKSKQEVPPSVSSSSSVAVSPSKKKTGASSVPIPDALAGNGFAEKWGEWLTYRSEKRKPVSEVAARKQLAQLSKDPRTAAAAIDQSIANDWQGLFPEKVRGKKADEPVDWSKEQGA